MSNKNIYDYIIVGSGLAGLYSAFNIPKEYRVLIITRAMPWECNSFYAQGGISVPKDNEDINLHIEDTLQAGAGLCDFSAVQTLVKDGKREIDRLIKLGLNFDKDNSGKLLYTKEGAHSTNRILHIGGDATGKYLHSFLINNLKDTIYEDSRVIDILVDGSQAYGVTVYRNGILENIYSKNLILATGGIGKLYKYSTNASTIFGDIQGIAVEKGIKLKDMEMLQFHPTTLLSQSGETFLISEALRGEGAYVIDEDDDRFLFKYDKRGELASRDIVSRAIMKHPKKAFLSIAHFKRDWFINRFPTISKLLINHGFNIPNDRIPISPAFHYTIGGIATDINGKVFGYQNLYAVGEVASTGVHGANRLASNSLLEAIVFSNRAIEDSLKNKSEFIFKEFPKSTKKLFLNSDQILQDELSDLLWKYVSIERRGAELQMVLNRIDQMLIIETGRLLKLQLFVAREIVSSSLQNRKSQGSHFRADI